MKLVARLLFLACLSYPFSALAIFDDCLEYFPRGEIPSLAQPGRDLCFDGFAVYYSPSDKKPIYVVEKLNRERLTRPKQARTNLFYEEARLPAAERASLSDYRGSGYDRGHNAPAGDMGDERSMAQSFSLANMMPQARQNNQGIWAKNVEEPTRQYAKRIDGDIYVYTGSVGKVGSIGNNHVTVPEYLFKLIYDPSRNLAWAYWIQNTDDAPMMAPIPYQDLALKTGIDFHLPASVATSSKPIHVRPERWNTTRPFHGFKNYQP